MNSSDVVESTKVESEIESLWPESKSKSESLGSESESEYSWSECKSESVSIRVDYKNRSNCYQRRFLRQTLNVKCPK